MPTLSYNGEIIPESAIVSQFLADAYPDKLLPPSAPGAAGALRRARVAFFVDTYFTKVQSHFFKFGAAKTDAAAEAVVDAAVAALVKEVEPLLADAKPLYGWSDHITLAEVRDAPPWPCYPPRLAWGGRVLLSLLTLPCHRLLPCVGPDRLLHHPPPRPVQGRYLPHELAHGHRGQGPPLPQVGYHRGRPSERE